jgi:hypothetical protein
MLIPEQVAMDPCYMTLKKPKKPRVAAPAEKYKPFLVQHCKIHHLLAMQAVSNGQREAHIPNAQ